MKPNLTAIVIDDEMTARKTLKTLLKMYCPDVTLIGEGDSVEAALELLSQEMPNIIFLDIEMPGKNGFELLKSLPEAQYAVIFTTAYAEYAIDAIKVAACDYLLKPIDVDELLNAVKKARAAIQKKSVLPGFQSLWEQLSKAVSKQILIPMQLKYEVLQYEEILYCESDRNYTRFFLQDGRSLLSSKTLKFFQDALSGDCFFRIHKSYIINLEHVKSIEKGLGGGVSMRNGSIIKIARDKKPILIERLSHI